ncbi:hypothetical protein GCM10007385_24020 [Tateyamaria omphalii]|uniref:hypothetical protein n=1 Tax=Tateyamaria omphalii TaxID=299262 RepID=UPI00167993D3|nr:hypothetical protein [Tateyamaria omphalii]GGX54863.1 hypothetical protein GCM10007385_24020 [Tateyamaria omphalii]
MFKSFFKSIAAAISIVVPAAIVLVGTAVITSASTAVVKPSPAYQGQWLTHPLGCEYSRAGRPGETMWFLIVNTRKKGCPTYITGNTWGDIYRAQGPKM